jgi:hypothetical protein
MVKESTRITLPVVLVKAKEASWSCNPPFAVLGVMVVDTEKSSGFGLELNSAWFVSAPDGAGPRSILVEQNWPEPPAME